MFDVLGTQKPRHQYDLLNFDQVFEKNNKHLDHFEEFSRLFSVFDRSGAFLDVFGCFWMGLERFKPWF